MVRDHVFISYRRDDARGASGRLYDWMRIAFGGERVFRDVHSISVGKWREQIDGALTRSVVCVAVIGPRWADAANLPRLHEEGDMVRHELAKALASEGLTLVPTLVEGAGVPRSADLPAVLRPLFEQWNALRVSEEGWEDDTRRLIAAIADTTDLAAGADVDELLRTVGAAQARVAELEQESQLRADQVEALRGTVAALQRRLAEAPAGERAGLAEAFAALARGDSLAAEDAFEREYEVQQRAEEEARRTMAVAARNVANLALLRDLEKAVSFYRRAVEADPDDAETARLLGHALILLGDLAGAEAALRASLRVAGARQDSRGEMAAYGGLGDVLRSTGDLAAAHAAYAAALQLGEQRLARDPANTQWQRDLSVSQKRIGDVLVAQGDGSGALSAYRASLAIHEGLVARDPANTEWQRDLSVSQEKIGNVLVAQGDVPGALSAYRSALAIREALVARDPANTEWQRDLSVSQEKIGDVLVAQGDLPGALRAYRSGLAIAEALAARDPANTQWQRDLLVGQIKVGDVLVAQEEGPGALRAYRSGLAIAEALAARDPANTQWQRDLSVSHERIGLVLLAREDGPGALSAFRRSLAIRETLVARHPANTDWQRDLAVSQNKIGDALFAGGDGPNALSAFRRSLAIAEALVARDPANTDWQRDLSVSQSRIGDVLHARGDGPGALSAFRRSLAIREALVARDPANTQWQRDLAVSCAKLGAVADGHNLDARRDYLLRGRGILTQLKNEGLEPNQDWIAWFDGQLAELASDAR